MCELCQTIFRRVPPKGTKTPPPVTTPRPPSASTPPPQVAAPLSAKRITGAFKTPSPEAAIPAPERASHSVANSSDEIKALLKEANRQGQLANADEFVRLHNRVFDLDPSQIESLRQMAIGKALLGRHAEALADFDELLRRKPDDATAIDNRATLLGRMGRLDEAISSFAGLLQRRPDSNTWHRRATCLQQAGRLQEALEDAKLSVEADADNFPAWQFRAELESQLGQNEAAIKSLRSALTRAPYVKLDPELVKLTRYRLWELEHPGQQLHPAEADALRAQAFTAGAQDQPQRALELLDQAIALDPFSPEAWFHRAAALVTLGRPEEAVDCYRKAAELDRHNRTIWRALARRLVSLQRWEEALRPLKHWIELDAEEVEAWKAKATALLRLRRFDEAVQAYDKAIALVPDDQELILGRSICLDEAEQQYQAAAQSAAQPLRPANVHESGRVTARSCDELPSLMSQANVLCSQGQHDEALPILDRILASAPASPQAQAQRAVALAALGRDSESSVRMLLNMSPDETALHRRLGQVMQALGRHNEAQLLFRHTLLKHQHADTWLALATSMAHLRQDKDALAACQRALDLDGDLHVARLLMGQLHERMHHSTEAADCYEQFISLAPLSMTKQANLARERLSSLRNV